MKLIKDMTEQELVNFSMGDIQFACNIPPIANALKEVTIRLRDLGCNGNNHIAMKWLIDKLASLTNRDVEPINTYEKTLVDNYYNSFGEVQS